MTTATYSDIEQALAEALARQRYNSDPEQSEYAEAAAILATPSMQAIARQAAIGAAVERLDDRLSTFRFEWNDHRSLGYQGYKFGKPSITSKALTLQEAITEADEYLAALGEDDECDIVVDGDDWPGAHYCRTHRKVHP